MRRLVAAVALAGLAVTGAVQAPSAAAAPVSDAGAGTEPASVPDELLVGYDAGTSPGDRADARSRAGSRLLSVVVGDAPGRSVVELVATPAGGRGQSERRFEADPHVAYAEPNWIYQHAATSNDPYYTGGNLWGMYGDVSSPANQYGSQAAEAWAAGNTGSSSVYVGVIDEGIQIDHPDLDANIWTNPYDTQDGVDNDGNGHIDDVNGWDFNGNNNSVYDGTGDDHGTHVAGTIGAEGGNGTGVAGVAWDVTLISAKFLGPRGGTTANAIKAVDYFTDLKTRHGLNIVATNNSWGGGGFSQGLYDAIGRAGTANILFIAAAGNGGSDGVGDNTDTTPHYPSSYANSNIISVASITSSGARSSFSNYGATSVDLGAPGSSIMSTLPYSKYGSYSGTSMATPHVTGAAALYASWKPGLSAAQIKTALMGSTSGTASLSGITVSGGRLDASSFGSVVVPDTTAPAAPRDVAVTVPGTRGALTVSWAANSEPDLAAYRVHRTDVSDPVTTVSAPTVSWTDTGLADDSTYSYYVIAVDSSGNPSPASETATGTTPVSPPASGDLTLLSATPYKVKGVQHVDLTISGGDLTQQVQIVRTGTQDGGGTVNYATTLTDNIGLKGGGTYTYRVCQGTSTCSGSLTVTF